MGRHAYRSVGCDYAAWGIPLGPMYTYYFALAQKSVAPKSGLGLLHRRHSFLSGCCRMCEPESFF